MNRSQSPAPSPRRSAATRAAMLTAARERFATDGYERATIRAIAKDANIDPSMVMRYYGNKEGLFAAAVAVDLRLPDPAGLPRREAGRALVTHFLAMWERNEVPTALLRVGATNQAGAERMQEIFREQVMPVAFHMCPDPEQAPARARCAPPSSWGRPSPGTSCASRRSWRGPARRSWRGWPRPCSGT